MKVFQPFKSFKPFKPSLKLATASSGVIDGIQF
jgi:hypothetical protein